MARIIENLLDSVGLTLKLLQILEMVRPYMNETNFSDNMIKVLAEVIDKKSCWFLFINF